MIKLTEKIRAAYKAQPLSSASSAGEITAPTMRRIALDTGVAIIAMTALYYIVSFIMVYIVQSLSAAGLFENEAVRTLAVYTASDIISYLPKILAFGVLYAKYRCLEPVYNTYENKRYYLPLLFIAMFSFGMWGSEITNLISLACQLLLGTGEIESVMDAVAPTSTAGAYISLFNAAVTAPLAEELIYRRYLLRSLRGMGDTPAIIISALIFALAHGNFDQFAYCFCGGIIFGLAAVRFNSVIIPIFLHVGNNLMVTVINYKDMFMTGIAPVDTITDAVAFISGLVINLSYYASALIALALVLSGAARLVPVSAPEKLRKLTACLCPVLCAGIFLMFAAFFF